MSKGETLATFRREVSANYNADALTRSIQDLIRHNVAVASGKLKGGIHYLFIKSWSKEHATDLAAIDEVLDAVGENEPLVIDVRLNSGGAEPLAQEVAGRFTTEPKIYAEQVYRDQSAASGFTPPMHRTLTPREDKPPLRGKVAVLMGPVNMSSCEGFLLMMRQVDGCRLVGAPSYGASGNPKPFALANGVTVYLPSWKAMDAEGVPFRRQGHRPRHPRRARPPRRPRGFRPRKSD